MNKLASWAKRRNIQLTHKQKEQKLPFYIRSVYSSYPTLEGRMFYVNSPKGDVFIHLFEYGGFHLDNGWDGGDLRSLPLVIAYYGDRNAA